MGMEFCEFDTRTNGPKSAFCGLRGTTRRVQAPGIESLKPDSKIRFRFEELFPGKNPAGISAVLGLTQIACSNVAIVGISGS